MRALLLAAWAAAAVFPDDRWSLETPPGWTEGGPECSEEDFLCWRRDGRSVLVTKADPAFVWRCGGEDIKAERFEPEALARAQRACDERAGLPASRLERAGGLSYLVTPLPPRAVRLRGYLGVAGGVYKVDAEMDERDLAPWVRALRSAAAAR